MSGGLEIKEVIGRMLLDARENPAVEAEVILENGAHGRASVSLKSGELAKKETTFIKGRLSEVILAEDAADQRHIDHLLLKVLNERNENQNSCFGALVLSMAAARAAGAGIGLPLYRYLGGSSSPVMPVPMIHMISNVDSSQDFQSIMVVPRKTDTYSEGLRMGLEIYHSLKRLLFINHYHISAGEAGGIAAKMKNAEEALAYLSEASMRCGYRTGKDVCAAVNMKGDWSEQKAHYQKQGVLLIMDSLTGENGSLVRMEDSGTVTGTLEVMKKVKKSGQKVILSNNFGETEEPFIADLAVAFGADFFKIGAPCCGECTAKYNELIRIEEFYKKER